MQICEAIKQIRTELGLTQVTFAQKLHVSFSTVNRWENGRVKPNRLATIMIISLTEEVKLNNDAVSLLKSTVEGG
jgi:DNA-binding transcriptional regulator YiaG